ncbi:MAG: gfo/Idh/MocA family oxidoreductase [Planctomycetota bacterium]|nr:MAG: gfo/Idh/MocA family oxidoreductase [Planctomycetota bacterium]
MSQSQVRIGIVGAGANTRARHIPGFRAIDGVEIVSVANRSLESARQVASDFQIPQVIERWQDLVASPEIDAVMIGTWPNMHCEVTCAALAAGKHVLCEARMARDLAEARQMLTASQAHPQLVAQIVPSPFGLDVGARVRRLLDDNFIGDLREFVVLAADDQFWDYSKPLHWRQDSQLSGKNILAMGIMHETLTRIIPDPTRVFAQGAIFEAQRPDPSINDYRNCDIPDSVQIVTQTATGAQGVYHLSGTVLYGPGKQIHLYGTRGTVKIVFGAREQVFTGHHSQSELREIDIPAAERGGWRVEAEFIGAIRGQEPVKYTTFADGVRYMEFTEAVGESLRRQVPIALPLA